MFSKFFTAFRSELIAGVGVLAVCGLGGAVISYLHIQNLNYRLQVKNEQVSSLTASVKESTRLRGLEQKNVLALQTRLATIEKQNDSAAAQLKSLEESNAEVKEYLARPIPADLRRLLNSQ